MSMLMLQPTDGLQLAKQQMEHVQRQFRAQHEARLAAEAEQVRQRFFLMYQVRHHLYRVAPGLARITL
jgi:hypothetical protein